MGVESEFGCSCGKCLLCVMSGVTDRYVEHSYEINQAAKLAGLSNQKSTGDDQAQVAEEINKSEK